MPFQKGNAVARETIGTKRIRADRFNYITEYLLADGVDTFLQIMQEQAKTNPEKYIATWLQLLEYIKPKLQRTEIKAEGGIQGTLVYLPSLKLPEIGQNESKQLPVPDGVVSVKSEPVKQKSLLEEIVERNKVFQQPEE